MISNEKTGLSQSPQSCSTTKKIVVYSGVKDIMAPLGRGGILAVKVKLCCCPGLELVPVPNKASISWVTD